MKLFTFLIAQLLLIFPLIAQNDDPCTASSLPVASACSYVSSTAVGSTASVGITAPGCASYVNSDVWFSMVVPASGNVQVDTQTGTITDGGMAFYTGSSCSALTLLSCDDDESANGLMPLLAATGLTPGSTLWVRFWKYGGGTGTFSICATTFNTPVNNDPASATLLTVGATCTPVTATLLGATQTMPGCTGTAEDDVWFSFTATQSSQLITVTPQSGIDPVVELFSGSPGALVSLSCSNSSYPWGATGTQIFSGLLVGQTYYFRVYDFYNDVPSSNEASFTVCVVNAPPPPLNDDCNGAVPLTVTEVCNPVSGSFFGASTSQVQACGTVSPTDVWYSFVAAQPYQNITVSTSAYSSVYVEVFSGDCNGLTSQFCSSYLVNSLPYLTIDDLVEGQTYYYRIYPNSSAYPGANATFTTCVTNPSSPTNQDCLGAIPLCNNIYSNPNAYSGVGNYNSEINSGISCLSSGEKNDVWYTFTVIESGNLNFTITPNVSTNDYDWAVFNLTNANCWDINNDASLQVACNFSGMSGPTGANGLTGSQNNPVIPVLAGQTYVVNVSQFSTSNAGYTINFSASTAVILDNIAPVFQAISTPSCGNTSVDVVFSENVLCSTASSNDFALEGPDGIHTITAINGIACELGGTMENTFTLTVTPPLNQNGTYTVSLLSSAGSVTDLCGNMAVPQSFQFTIQRPNVEAELMQNVLCYGGNDGVLTAQSTGGTGTISYQWTPSVDASADSSVYSNVTAGVYVVEVTDANGCSDSDTIEVMQPEELSAQMLVTQPSCGGSGAIEIVPSGGTGTIQFDWLPIVSTSEIASNLNGGNYEITLTDANGCVLQIDTVLQQGGIITASINSQQAQCLTGNSFDFTTQQTGIYTYSWDFGDGTPIQTDSTAQHSYSTPGIYAVQMILTQGICSDTATVNIEVYEMPEINLSLQNPLCNGTADGQVTAVVTGGNPSYNFDWGTTLGTTTQPVMTNLSAGIYQVTVSDENGCSDSEQVILSDPLPLTIELTVQQPTCTLLGSIDVLANGGSGNFNYTWNPSAYSGSSLNQLIPGNYSVTVSDSNGCSVDTSAVLAITDQFSVAINSQNGQCLDGNNFQFSTGSTQSGIQYVWNFGDTQMNNAAQPSHSYVNAGSYNVNLVATYGACVDTAESLVTVFAMPEVQISSNIPCEGQTLELSATPLSFQQYGWIGPNGQQYNGSQLLLTGVTNFDAGNYTLIVEDVNGCLDTATTVVQILPNPQFTINVLEDEGCPPFTTSFSTNLANAQSYLWNFGDGSQSNQQYPAHEFMESGTYSASLTIINSAGCTNTVSVGATVTVFEVPEALFTVLQNDDDFATSMVTFSNNSSLDVTEWSWNFGDGPSGSLEYSPVHTYLETGQGYTVLLSVENEYGCTDTISQNIFIKDPLLFYVPNSFTPDGDQFNQVFKPVFTSGYDPYDFELSIFNRWGELIYESHDANVGWDGTYMNRMVQEGIYTWVIAFGVLSDDERKVIRGSVCLLK